MRTPHDDVRLLLAAQPGELDVNEERLRARHLGRCHTCTEEARRYEELAHGLRAMAQLETQPPPTLLPNLLATTRPRRVGPRTIAAGGALVATVAVMAGVLHHYRRRERLDPLGFPEVVAAVPAHV